MQKRMESTGRSTECSGNNNLQDFVRYLRTADTAGRGRGHSLLSWHQAPAWTKVGQKSAKWFWAQNIGVGQKSAKSRPNAFWPNRKSARGIAALTDFIRNSLRLWRGLPAEGSGAKADRESAKSRPKVGQKSAKQNFRTVSAGACLESIWDFR